MHNVKTPVIVRDDAALDYSAPFLIAHLLIDDKGRNPPVIDVRTYTPAGPGKENPSAEPVANIILDMQGGRPTLMVAIGEWEESLVIDLRDGSVVQEASP